MFTSQIQSEQNTQSQETGKKIITEVCGVDVSNYKCYQLNHSDPVYKIFDNSTIHYAINAMQKGLKPPTKIGLKRLKKRTLIKKMRLQNPNLDPKLFKRMISIGARRNQFKIQAQPVAKPLNPLSTEELCLKSLRTKFREEMEKKNKDNDEKTVNNSQIKIFGPADKLRQERHKNRKPKFIRKKQNQKKRRAQLLYLVHEYGTILKQIFPAERLEGFHLRSKIPKISRQQIKDALANYFNEKSQMLGNQEKMTKIVEDKFKQLDQEKKRRQRRRYSVDGSQQSSSSSNKSDGSSSSSSSESSPESEAESQESLGRKKVKVDSF